MGAKKYELDMCEGSVLKKLLLFTIPLMMTSFFQLLYNAADLVVVSRFAGSNAMASVGATASVSSFFVNLGVGLSLGSGVVVARSFGARDNDAISKAVHTAIFTGIFLGILVSVLGITFSRPLLVLMGTPSGEVLDGAVLYMRIFFVGSIASVIYNFAASVLRAVGDTKRPLYILASTGIVNVLLNLLFVIYFDMGVAGVAIATAVANVLSMIFIIQVLVRSEASYKLFFSKIRLHKAQLLEMIKIGLPAGLQSSFFSMSNSVIQSSVNSFGAAAVAGNAAGANIENFVYTAMNAFHQSTVTAVSQNFGALKKKRINKTIWTSLACVTVTGLVFGGLSVVFADKLLAIYINDSQKAIEYGKLRIIITGAPYFLCGIMDVLAGYLRGLGASSVSMLNSFFGACVFRVLWIIFVLPLYPVFAMIYIGQSVSWVLVIIMHIIALISVKKRAMAKLDEQLTKRAL